MNENLFIDLFAYRQRENKDPLEDWATECLAATIRAMPAGNLAEFLAAVSNIQAQDILPYAEKAQIEVLTQYYAGSAGRPDMLIKLADEPWLLFENKVGHSVSEREKSSGEKSHQLRDYAEWLARHGQECPLPRAIVFVTHLTPPPPDFGARSPVDYYHGFYCGHFSWGALARLLKQFGESLPEDAHATAMARAFLTYLENKNMSNEFPDAAAFAAAEVYVSQAATIENLVGAMWRAALDIAHFGKTADYTLKAVTDDGTIAAWRWVAPGEASNSRDSWIETGIWFPELGQWFDRDQIGDELKGPYAYVGMLNGEDGYFTQTDEVPAGFLRPASDFLAIKAVADFSSDPQKRGEGIVEWVSQQSSVLRSFLLKHKIVK